MKKRFSFVVILSLSFMLPVTTLMIAAQTGKEGDAAPPRPKGPCDIYTVAGNPCVAAHSTTRALYASYNGPLYQVMRQSDGKTLDIGVVHTTASPVPDAGGYADAAAQDAFCANTDCWITTVYDQSGKGNHLVQAPPGTFKGPAKGGFNTLPIADMAPITIMGHKAYGVYIMPGMGLRNNNAADLSINDEPQGVYMVFDGTHYDSGCCFNYGNTSTNSRAVGRGTMETVYFGTATAWGKGSGHGPWIMSDMEAGLFSGYNSGVNEGSPTIDSWRFVTGVVNGGGGNQWQIRGGNAQQGGLATFYNGVRPGSRENSNYYPMHRKGAVQMGNGGDNGNGSAGTFYEGVMTSGYPTDATTDAVQANIVAAQYDMQRVNLSRLVTFTPRSAQNVTVTFTNTTGAPVTGVKLSIHTPTGWTSVVSGSTNPSKTFVDPVAPGASLQATFKVSSPVIPGAGFLAGRAEWKNLTIGQTQFETITRKVRNVFPVKINEVRFSTSTNSTNQFIELYNAGDHDVDISNWSLINTQSQWAPIKAATIPAGTKFAAGDFYLLGLSSSGLAAPTSPGTTTIYVRNTDGFEIDQQVDIGDEIRKIANVGTAASPMTTVFVPVSTGPRLTIPVGSTNLPVTNATGFVIGQKIGIDIGGNYELATVTTVGKAATQTNLSAAADAGATNIKVAATSNMTVGDTLTVGTGGRKELVKVTKVGSTGANGMGVDLAGPLKFDHMSGVDVSDVGTGVSFSPATRFPHASGDAVQALGSGIKLDSALDKNHEYGAAVVNPQIKTTGYQGTTAPDQWYGGPFSTSAGSIALMDASGKVVVDAMVYGSQQSSSSANGTITSPEIAILEGDQNQGGCIVVAPGASRGFGFGRRGSSAGGETNKSVGRFPDGADTDSNCNDFLIQASGTTIAAASAIGTSNIKIASVEGFGPGQTIILDIGENQETAVIETVGTAGGTTVSTATDAGVTVIPVADVAGFSAGQSITIDSGTKRESAVVASVSGGRRGFGGRGGRARGAGDTTITITSPLAKSHGTGTEVSGTGITLTKALTRAHDTGSQVTVSPPTPGAPNQYSRELQ